MHSVLTNGACFVHAFNYRVGRRSSRHIDNLLSSYNYLVTLSPRRTSVIIFVAYYIHRTTSAHLCKRYGSYGDLPPSPSNGHIITINNYVTRHSNRNLLAGISGIGIVFNARSVTRITRLVTRTFLSNGHRVHAGRRRSASTVDVP